MTAIQSSSVLPPLDVRSQGDVLSEFCQDMATALQPLILPEVVISPRSTLPTKTSMKSPEKLSTPSDGSPCDAQLCMLCSKTFDMDLQRDDFSAHLIMDHNLIIADVKHIPYFPGYVEGWRKIFKQHSVESLCPKIPINYNTSQEEASDRTGSSSSGDGAASPDYTSNPTLDPDFTRKNVIRQSDAAALGAQCPEAGDAPATDVMIFQNLKLSPRPALEVEDPAIAAAHPAIPSVFKMEDLPGKEKRNQPTLPTSSASVDSVTSSTSSCSSFLSTSASTVQIVGQALGEDYHYLLCDNIPQDYALRQRLQRKRLEYALQRQESERKDNTFSRQCLFCITYFEGNRAGLFHHMAEEHNFNVGQPDNIVFSNEFLDTLQSKLDNSICLYCEKDFRDKATLKDHMRKKMHRRIRGSNREYDKFYLINYLELGKSWNDIQGEEDIEIRPGPAAESEWADWTGEGTFSVCLFCSFPCTSADEILLHMRNTHGFDLVKIRTSLKLSFYQQIKLINFYRRKLHENSCPSCNLKFADKETVVRHMVDSNHVTDVPALFQWDQPQFFFPTYENDHLLSLLEDLDDNPEVAVVQPEDPPDSSIYNSILSREMLRQEIIADCGHAGYKGRGWK